MTATHWLTFVGTASAVMQWSHATIAIAPKGAPVHAMEGVPTRVLTGSPEVSPKDIVHND